MPNNEGDLKTLLANSYLVCFDNTATLTTQFSNILCAAITGSKDAKRKLYSDCDQIILNLHNLVVINGIDIVPYKSDLAERSLLFELLPISPKDRKTDAKFWGDFAKDKPFILDALYATLAQAITILPDIKEENLHRMADANLECIAVGEALGIPQEEFQRILWDNNKKLQEAYAQNNPFVDAIVSYVMTHGSIDNRATEVYRIISNSIPGNPKFFPDSPSSLSRKLNEERDALEQAGVRFNRYKRPDSNYISLKKIPKSQQTKAQKVSSGRKANP